MDNLYIEDKVGAMLLILLPSYAQRSHGVLSLSQLIPELSMRKITKSFVKKRTPLLQSPVKSRNEFVLLSSAERAGDRSRNVICD